MGDEDQGQQASDRIQDETSISPTEPSVRRRNVHFQKTEEVEAPAAQDSVLPAAQMTENVPDVPGDAESGGLISGMRAMKRNMLRRQLQAEKKKIVAVLMEDAAPQRRGTKCTAVLEGFSEDSAVSQLKEMIALEYSIPISHQSLWFRPREKKGQEETVNVLERKLEDHEKLGEIGMELGWKKGHLVVHSDTLELRTALPMEQYYPGGEYWSMGVTTNSTTRGNRMTQAFTGLVAFLFAFSWIISYLTS